MRRRAGVLLPLEEAILAAGLAATRSGDSRFHGFALAKALQEADEARRLTAHGTLYKALGRLEKAGMLASTWEDAAIAETEGRPRRRLYEVTGEGERAYYAALAERPAPQPGRPGLAT
jgi:DNA-binding PadR family transcriptional regulator